MEMLRKGDRVQVREWIDMEHEFGLNENGDIDTLYAFLNEMDILCGQYATVLDIISVDGDVQTIKVQPNKENETFDWDWMFTNEMFNKVK